MTVLERDHGLTRHKHGPDERGTEGKGCRCTLCREASAAYDRRRNRMIAYGQWNPRRSLPSSAGTRRRLQALIFNGWSFTELSGRLGWTRPVLVAKLRRWEHVAPATAAAVRALYDELWDQQPPARTRYERGAATRARNYARARGLVPPLAWDDDEIDNPDATPVPGWERNRGTRRYGVLAEDALFLLAAGDDERQVAERLGVAPGTIGVTLARAARKQQEASRAA